MHLWPSWCADTIHEPCDEFVAATTRFTFQCHRIMNHEAWAKTSACNKVRWNFTTSGPQLLLYANFTKCECIGLWYESVPPTSCTAAKPRTALS